MYTCSPHPAKMAHWAKLYGRCLRMKLYMRILIRMTGIAPTLFYLFHFYIRIRMCGYWYWYGDVGVGNKMNSYPLDKKILNTSVNYIDTTTSTIVPRNVFEKDNQRSFQRTFGFISNPIIQVYIVVERYHNHHSIGLWMLWNAGFHNNLRSTYLSPLRRANNTQNKNCINFICKIFKWKPNNIRYKVYCKVLKISAHAYNKISSWNMRLFSICAYTFGYICIYFRYALI